MNGRCAAYNNREEDARHLYMWSSLHCVRPQSRRFATSVAGDRNDFFPMDVRRHARRTLCFECCLLANRMEDYDFTSR